MVCYRLKVCNDSIKSVSVSKHQTTFKASEGEVVSS